MNDFCEFIIYLQVHITKYAYVKKFYISRLCTILFFVVLYADVYHVSQWRSKYSWASKLIYPDSGVCHSANFLQAYNIPSSSKEESNIRLYKTKRTGKKKYKIKHKTQI